MFLTFVHSSRNNGTDFISYLNCEVIKGSEIESKIIPPDRILLILGIHQIHLKVRVD